MSVFTLGVFDGGQLVPSPQRTHRTATSWFVTFGASGRARYTQGALPKGRIAHGPFSTKYAAMKYVRDLP